MDNFQYLGSWQRYWAHNAEISICYDQQTGMGQTHPIRASAGEMDRLHKLFSIHILYEVIIRLARNIFLTSSVPCIGLPSVSSFNPPLSYKWSIDFLSLKPSIRACNLRNILEYLLSIIQRNKPVPCVGSYRNIQLRCYLYKNKDQKCHYLYSNCPDIVLLFFKTNNIYAMQTSANLIDHRERDGLKRKWSAILGDSWQI